MIFLVNTLYYNISEVLYKVCKLMTQTTDKIQLIGMTVKSQTQDPTGKKINLKSQTRSLTCRLRLS